MFLTRTMRVAAERRVKSDSRMSLSCPLDHWWRRLMSADTVIQWKMRTRLLARLITTRLATKPRGRKISSNRSRSWCCSSAETSLHCDTILSSVRVTSSTDDSSNSASTEIWHKRKFYYILSLQKKHLAIWDIVQIAKKGSVDCVL